MQHPLNYIPVPRYSDTLRPAPPVPACQGAARLTPHSPLPALFQTSTRPLNRFIVSSSPQPPYCWACFPAPYSVVVRGHCTVVVQCSQPPPRLLVVTVLAPFPLHCCGGVFPARTKVTCGDGPSPVPTIVPIVLNSEVFPAPSMYLIEQLAKHSGLIGVGAESTARWCRCRRSAPNLEVQSQPFIENLTTSSRTGIISRVEHRNFLSDYFLATLPSYWVWALSIVLDQVVWLAQPTVMLFRGV